MASDSDEIIMPFPAPVERLGQSTHLRSTLLASSIQSLRARGLYERYRELLPSELREEITSSVAGEWLPIDRGIAHYTACDGLELNAEEQRGMGHDVSKRVHDTFLGFMVQAARGVGVTPWSLLPRGNWLYTRLFRGGGIQVTKVGAQEARVEFAGLSLTRIPYFGNALLGMYEAGLGMFAERVFVRPMPGQAQSASRVMLRVQWL